MRFTIRDLLWLMVVAGLSAGWWAERNRADIAYRHAAERSSRIMVLEEAVDHVLRLWEHDIPGTVTLEPGSGHYIVNAKAGRYYLLVGPLPDKPPAKR